MAIGMANFPNIQHTMVFTTDQPHGIQFDMRFNNNFLSTKDLCLEGNLRFNLSNVLFI